MSKLSEAEKALLRDLQAVLKKHGARLVADVGDVGIIGEKAGIGLYIPEIGGNWIDAESFTQSDIDGDK